MERPWISANLAISADGKISSVRKCPSGWTSADDHRRLLELRAGTDALLVGRGTLVADRMTMTMPGAERQPLRCVVSQSGALSADHPLFHTPGGAIHVCVTGVASPDLPGATIHRMALAEFLSTLAAGSGVRRLHCEGGGELVRALAEMDAIDELHLTLAGHTLFGGLAAPTITGVPAAFFGPSRGFELSNFDPRPENGECFLSYRRAR